MTADDNLINKVKKLLALTESPNEAEATLAAEKAQELMLRYGIQLAQVAAAEGDRVGVNREMVNGKVDPWRRYLAAAVAKSMGGQLLYSNEYRKWTGTLEFWGERGTTASMVAMYQYLEAQLLAISAIGAANEGRERRWCNAAESMRWRRSFLLGAVTRISSRLEERKQSMVAESDDSMALVRLTDAVQDAIDEKYDRLRKERKPTHDIDYRAYDKGRAAGSNVDFNDDRVGRGRKGIPA